jgi:hypothetical protein
MQRRRPSARYNQMKTARVILHIEPALKVAGERAAASDRRSLSGLIEMLLIDYCKHQAMAEASSSASRSVASPKAAKMAASTIDDIGDRTLPRDEQQRRKRALIHGPKEFREIRRK